MGRVGKALHFSFASVCLGAGLTLSGVQAVAQGSPGRTFGGEAAKSKDVKFEVISIRPVLPGVPMGTGYTSNPTPDGFISSLTLWQMFMVAYAPDDQSWGSIPIVNWPHWQPDWYVINARVSDADRDAWRNQSKNHELLRSAMRDLLKERCKLAVRKEPTEVPDYKLVIGKRGLKGLRPAVPGSMPPADAHALPTGGFRIATGDRSRPTWHYYAATIGELVDFLSPAGTGSPAPPIHDETGLTGRYDFALTMIDEPSRDLREEMFNFPLGPLGLELEPGKYHGVKLVIDHMEKPSAN